jgi:hypothetical protein
MQIYIQIWSLCEDSSTQAYQRIIERAICCSKLLSANGPTSNGMKTAKLSDNGGSRAMPGCGGHVSRFLLQPTEATARRQW